MVLPRRICRWRGGGGGTVLGYDDGGMGSGREEGGRGYGVGYGVDSTP